MPHRAGMRSALLIRHCEAAWSEDNASRPLSELGVAQAQRLGEWLQQRWSPDAIVSSPYRRAVDTIAPFAAVAGLNIGLDERLRERKGPFLPEAADHIAAAEACFADHELRLQAAETGREAQKRGWQAIEAALASHELPVLVTHGQLLSFTLARIDGTTGVERWRTMTTPDVFLLESDAVQYRLEKIWEPEAHAHR